MRRLPRPASSVREVLNLCIASIRDSDLSLRLQHASETIEAAENDYIVRGGNAALFTIPGTNGVAGHVSTAEMERVYNGTFVRSKNTRGIYGAIMKMPVNDICPLCGQRTVFTLDHYLPKSAHPALAITSVNLVPACSECNKIKLAFQATAANDQTLHPYFDDIDDDRWLFASVQEITPAALVFSANPPASWNSVKRARVVAHFHAFALGRLYASHSAVELNNVHFSLQQMAMRNSPQAISEYLAEIATSCSVAHCNSWQRAMYGALAASEWFCSGGFE